MEMKTLMRRTLCLGFLIVILPCVQNSQDTHLPARGQQIPRPTACIFPTMHGKGPHGLPARPFMHERWLTDLSIGGRTPRSHHVSIPSRYELPALRWTQSSFMQPQMMVQDRYFYDPSRAVHRGPLSG